MFPMMLLILIISSNVSAGANLTKKLDQTLMPQEPDTTVKCGSSPSVDPCSQLPPPPPPTTTCCTSLTPPPPPPPTTTCCTSLTPPPPPPPTTTCCTPLTPPPPPPTTTTCCTPLTPPPTTTCCTPLTTPPPRFFYFTNKPGNVYVADPDDQWGFYNGAAQRSTSWFLLLVAVGILNRL